MGVSRSSELRLTRADQLLPISCPEQCCIISCINRAPTCNLRCHPTLLTLPQYLDGEGKDAFCHSVFIDLTSPRLMSLYNNVHASIHAKNTRVKVHHCVSRSASSFAWVTPAFELYCVAEPHANRNALVQSATKVAQWVQQEEERLFIIGGAVRSFTFISRLPTLY